MNTVCKMLMTILVLLTTMQLCAYKKNLKRITCTMNDAREININLGTVRLYFDQKPVITTMPTQGDGTIVFFMPLASSSDAHVFDQLNGMRSQLYSIQARYVHDPMVGIEITITYDPAVVLVKHELFQSADMSHGVAVYIYHQGVVKSIENTEDRLLMIS